MRPGAASTRFIHIIDVIDEGRRAVGEVVLGGHGQCRLGQRVQQFAFQNRPRRRWGEHSCLDGLHRCFFHDYLQR